MKNIIITGGELFNKGAQAMVFVTVDELKKRFPGHKIYVLSEMDNRRSQSEKDKYNFEFTGWYPLKYAKAQKNPLLRLLCKIKNGKELKKVEELYRNADMMLDISGYALGSNWSSQYCMAYIEHLIYADAFKIPVYLLPQSFGPFDFKGKEGIEIEQLIKKYLPGVKLICAREQDGYDILVNKYKLDNVCRKTDLVLNNKGIALENVYREIPEIKLPFIEKESAAIIPNARNNDLSDSAGIKKLYNSIVRQLIAEGKHVYLLSHATHDLKLCTEIKAEFADEERVHCFEQEFSCIEFNELVSRFEFLVASRFHSIVHAYKNGTPCIVLGWAVKYHELLMQFEQEKYMFDVRSDICLNDISAAVSCMIKKKDNESEKIKRILSDAQKENVFDIL